MTLILDPDPQSAVLPAAPSQACAPIVIAAERPEDEAGREALLDAAFGAARSGKTSAKLRRGRLPARGLALVARHGDAVVGTVRLWHVAAGGAPALLLGPLAVDARYRDHGIGSTLMRQGVEQARSLGHRAILLVGDAPYYARFGFSRDATRGLRLPGPVEPGRFLGLELEAGALAGAKGLLRATGAVDLTRRRSGPTRRARLHAAA